MTSARHEVLKRPLFRDARRGVAARSGRRAALAVKTVRLFAPEEARDYQLLWSLIEGGFVRTPRRAMEQADGLAVGAMRRLTEILAEERAHLEKQWSRDERVSAKTLRLAVHHYRSFFSHLSSM